MKIRVLSRKSDLAVIQAHEFGKILSNPSILGIADFIVGNDLLHDSCKLPSAFKIFGPTIPILSLVSI